MKAVAKRAVIVLLVVLPVAMPLMAAPPLLKAMPEEVGMSSGNH